MKPCIHLRNQKSSPDTLIAGTFNGIFRSDDAGESVEATSDSKYAGIDSC